MPGGKGKSAGGKSSGGKTSAGDNQKKQMSHSERAGLQVSRIPSVLTMMCPDFCALADFVLHCVHLPAPRRPPPCWNPDASKSSDQRKQTYATATDSRKLALGCGIRCAKVCWAARSLNGDGLIARAERGRSGCAQRSQFTNQCTELDRHRFSIEPSGTNPRPVPLRSCQAFPQEQHPEQDACWRKGRGIRNRGSGVPDCRSPRTRRRKLPPRSLLINETRS